jgi:hypothetical protein
MRAKELYYKGNCDGEQHSFPRTLSLGKIKEKREKEKLITYIKI